MGRRWAYRYHRFNGPWITVLIDGTARIATGLDGTTLVLRHEGEQLMVLGSLSGPEQVEVAELKGPAKLAAYNPLSLVTEPRMAYPRRETLFDGE